MSEFVLIFLCYWSKTFRVDHVITSVVVLHDAVLYCSYKVKGGDTIVWPSKLLTLTCSEHNRRASLTEKKKEMCVRPRRSFMLPTLDAPNI